MRRLGLFAVSLAALIAAGLAGALISGHLSTSRPTPSTTSTTGHRSTTTTTVPHAGVTVLVANGTLENGAAAHFTQLLQSQGWGTATPTNTTSQVAVSNVYYVPGKLPAALLIASQVGVAASAVQPLTASVPLGTTLGIGVVVIVGPDLAAQAAATTTTG
jgi:hypothetical protein